MLQDIMKKHLEAHDLPAAERTTLRRLLARQEARRRMVPRDPHASRGFVRIERVASAEPMKLFGQTAPSFACNRIVLSFGAQSGEGKTRPGKPVLTALISEESLAQLMLSPNRSNDHIALTAESWLGERMPRWQGEEAHPGDVLEDQLSETLGERRAALDALREGVSGLTKAIPKGVRQEMSALLGKVASKGNVRFYLERHSENLQRILVQNRVEASTAALNMEAIGRAAEQGHLLEAQDTPEITAPDLARDDNAMLDAAMEKFTPEEAAVARRAAVAWLSGYLRETYPEVAYDADQDDPHAKRMRTALTRRATDEDRLRLENVAILISSLGNPYVNERRAQADGFKLTASCSFRQGGSHALHSSFPDHDHGYFALSIKVAAEDDSFGNRKIRGGTTVVEIGMSPEDLMTALRGHPTGQDLPCSIDRIASQGLKRVHIQGEMEAVIEGGAADPDVHAAERDLAQLLTQAGEIVQAGAQRAADRKALADLLERIDLSVEAFSGLEARDAESRAREMQGIVRDMNAGAMRAINDYVLEHHGRTLPMLAFDEQVASPTDI